MTHKNLFFALLVGVAVILSGCFHSPADRVTEETPQIANPASQNCVDRGGELEIRENAEGGKYGVCKFEDGSECEEWEFFHGLCKPGEQEMADDETATPPAETGDEEDLDRMEEEESDGDAMMEEEEEDASEEQETESITSDIISVDFPSPGEQLTSPFEVTGTARNYPSPLNVDVTTLDGTQLITQEASKGGEGLGDDRISFKQKIFYEFSSTKEGYIEVYYFDVETQEKVGLVKIPVKF